MLMPHAPEPEPSWHGVDPEQPDAERWDDPFPSLAWFRAHAPVNHTPAQLWRVYRYADCWRVLRELPCGVRRTDGSAPGNAMGGGTSDGAGGQFMLQQDPPNHTRLRKLVSKAFTPRAIERLRPRAQQVAERAASTASPPRGEMDVIADLALPVPSTTDLRDDGRAGRRPRPLHRVDRGGDASARLHAGAARGDGARAWRATVRRSRGYFEALIEERRSSARRRHPERS